MVQAGGVIHDDISTMNTKYITKDQFVALLVAAGVSDSQMRNFHHSFEKQHPEEHESFLRSLGLPGEKVREIRALSLN